MKASEYGGSDTVKTQGIQPPPHIPTPAERLRQLASIDPMSIDGDLVVTTERA